MATLKAAAGPAQREESLCHLPEWVPRLGTLRVRRKLDFSHSPAVDPGQVN